MKNIKYILLGISLSVFIFITTNFIFSEWYKVTMFSVDEDVTYTVKVNTDDTETLSVIETILKSNAENNFSIVVHNNNKSNLNYTEYNFFTTDHDYKSKIITYQDVDFSSSFELKTGDDILFDPIVNHPIMIKNINFKDMSENAIVVLFNFKDKDTGYIIDRLQTDLEVNNVRDFVSLEEMILYEESNSSGKMFLTNYHLYIFTICSLISILIFKDINNNFKEISLMKIEGESNFSIYNHFALMKIILVSFTMLLVLLLLTIIKYNVSPSLVLLYYKFLLIHFISSILLILALTLPGYFVISKTKIYSAIKGFNQLETSIICLSFLKIAILILTTVMIMNYIKVLPDTITGLLNYNQSLEKYKNLYIINSSLNEDVNQVVEIERIKEILVNEHEGFSTVCLPEGESSEYIFDESMQGKMYSSIYYIVDSNINKISIDPNRNLDHYVKETFNHYGFDSFEIENTNLKNDDFLYCTRNILSPFNEKLYYKDYDVIKIEVLNIYDHNLNPDFILFKANSEEKAIKIIDDIYLEYGERNQLIVESVEEELRFSRNLTVEFVKEALINLILIASLLFVINNELVNNFINYDQEENIYLHLIGKSRFYMVRKYVLLSTIILFGYFCIQLFISYKYSVKIEVYLYALLILIEIVSVIYYVSKINLRKLRGL